MPADQEKLARDERHELFGRVSGIEQRLSRFDGVVSQLITAVERLDEAVESLRTPDRTVKGAVVALLGSTLLLIGAFANQTVEITRERIENTETRLMGEIQHRADIDKMRNAFSGRLSEARDRALCALMARAIAERWQYHEDDREGLSDRELHKMCELALTPQD